MTKYKPYLQVCSVLATEGGNCIFFLSEIGLVGNQLNTHESQLQYCDINLIEMLCRRIIKGKGKKNKRIKNFFEYNCIIADVVM